MDVFGLHDDTILKQVFLSNGDSSSWQIWEKPKNCKFVGIFMLGGGGGGGAGFSAAINTATGGGGGGSSAITKGLFQSNVLPDTLYIQVGVGGSGGTNSVVTAAQTGGISYVAVDPATTAGGVILASGAAGGGAGGPGTGAAGGTAGIAGTVFSQTNFYLSTLGIVQSQVGQAGSAGGANTPTAVAITLPVTGGAGGGGVTAGGAAAAGANITGAGFVPTITGGANTGVDGSSGFQPTKPGFFNRYPLFGTGGAGGGGNSTGAGGVGGFGGYGCGGGGGGASDVSTTLGGTGGKGGDGIVIIASW